MLLLGGGMAALFAWRSCQSPSVGPAPLPSASAPVAPRPPPHDDTADIPPPPPLPDASPDTGAPKPTTTVSSGGGDGCAATSCNGRINPELSNALAFRAKTAHKCYDEALGQDPTLKGQVVINVRVGNNGTVCSAAVESSDVASPSVAPCIANKFRQGARLPSPAGGCLDVNVPMKLLPPH